MQIEIIDQIEKLPDIKQHWQELYQDLRGQLSPFSSYQWHETWWRHYSAGEAMHIMIGWDADRVVGIAPLMCRPATLHGLSAQVVCFIENNQSALCDFIVLPEFRDEFLRSLLQALKTPTGNNSWDVLVLNKLSVLSENYAGLVGILNESGDRWQEEQAFDGRYLVPNGSWQQFWASRSTRTRKSLRPVQNRMQKAGSASIEHIQTFARLEQVWTEICRVAQGSWTGQTGESLASPANEAFFLDLAQQAATEGWLSVWTLRLKEKMLAVEFHLRAHGKEYAMCGHFLPEDQRLSPGTYLEMQILKHVFSEEERLQKYDLGEYYPYKRKWAENSEPHMKLSIFNQQLYSRLLSFHEMRTVPILRRIIPQHVWQHRIFKLLGIKTAPYEIRQH